MKNVCANALSSFLVFTTLLSATLSAQVSPYVVDVKIPTASEKSPLSISVELTQNTQIRKIVLHYREFGKTEFKQMDMLLSGRTAVATIPAAALTPPSIEYYIGLQLADSKLATFPSESPEINPLRIEVKEVDARDLEARFLSPEAGETLTAEDLAVAVSLMYVSNKVDVTRTRVYLDGVDVTSEAVITEDVVLYSPKNFDKPLNVGTHSIKIELRDTLDAIYYTKQESFNLSTASAIEEEKSSLQYTGFAQGEFRNEKLDVATTSYIRTDAHVGGTYKEYAFGADIHVTNEEKSYLQPQNRYLATFQASDYAKVQIGDAYPQFPSLVVSGKRVRGISGAFTVGFFNLDVSYGRTNSAIEGAKRGLVRYDSVSLAYRDSLDKVYVRSDTGTSVIYQLFDRGTFGRNFFAVRPSFGKGENFQFGITYMHSKDDKGSITYGKNPAENCVAGMDLLLAFDNQKIRWTTQAAFSLENNDISEGDYTDAQYDDFKGVNDTSKTPEERQTAKDEADKLKSIAKVVKSFITANGNLTPLDPKKGWPSVAYESELTLNYFDNFVRCMFFRRGIGYTSFGNDFIQNDIIGFNVSDRVRLFDNKALVSVSYETKSNNTMDEASTPTTTYHTFNTSVTGYPGAAYPSFTLGYGFNTRKNPLDVSRYAAANKPLIRDYDANALDTLTQKLYTIVATDTLALIADELTNRYFLATNYDFVYSGRHTVTATLSIANKKDRTFYHRDIDNINVGMTLSSYFTIPLQTTLSYIVSQSSAYSAMQDSVRAYLGTTQKQTFRYQTLSIGARYRLKDDKMNVLATVAPSFGDYKRLLVQAGIDYQFVENHYLVSQCDVIKYSGRASDIIFSLLYRYLF